MSFPQAGAFKHLVSISGGGLEGLYSMFGPLLFWTPQINKSIGRCREHNVVLSL